MDNAADQIDGTVYSVGGVQRRRDHRRTGTPTTRPATRGAPIANMAVAREKPGAGAIGGKLYVTGGWDTERQPVAEHRCLRPRRGRLGDRGAEPGPAGRSRHSGCRRQALPGRRMRGRLLHPVEHVVRYDPAADSWETLAPYPHTTSWISCGGIDGNVYCAGGINGGHVPQRRVRVRPGRRLVVADRADALQPVGLGLRGRQRDAPDRAAA